MITVTIPRLAMVCRLTDHAIMRYIQRRKSLPCFIIDDLIASRPLTKGRMNRIGIKLRRGSEYLRTPDGFIFVTEGERIVTCYHENTKGSPYEFDPLKEKGRRTSRRPRHHTGARRQPQSRTSLMAELRKIPPQT